MLVQTFHEKAETVDVFKKYSRKLIISQITVWVCHVKKYFAIIWLHDVKLNLIFWVSSQKSLIWNTKYYWSGVY